MSLYDEAIVQLDYEQLVTDNLERLRRKTLTHESDSLVTVLPAVDPDTLRPSNAKRHTQYIDSVATYRGYERKRINPQGRRREFVD